MNGKRLPMMLKLNNLKAATDVYKADTQYKIAKENKNQYDKK